MRTVIGFIVGLWLLIGVAATYQRGYFDNHGSMSCRRTGDIVLTVLAGPLNYAGVNPQVNCNRVPHPSS